MNLRRVLSPLLLAVMLTGAAACGGGGSDGDGADKSAAPVTPESAAPEAPRSTAPEAPRSVVPAAAMVNVMTGEAADPRSFVTSDKPVLYWFWAPH